jgi:hypothetical protein
MALHLKKLPEAETESCKALDEVVAGGEMSSVLWLSSSSSSSVFGWYSV